MVSLGLRLEKHVPETLFSKYHVSLGKFRIGCKKMITGVHSTQNVMVQVLGFHRVYCKHKKQVSFRILIVLPQHKPGVTGASISLKELSKVGSPNFTSVWAQNPPCIFCEFLICLLFPLPSGSASSVWPCITFHGKVDPTHELRDE